MLFNTFNYVRYDFLCHLLLEKGIKTFTELLTFKGTPELSGLRQDEIEMAFSWIKQLSNNGVQAFPEVKYVIFTRVNSK